MAARLDRQALTDEQAAVLRTVADEKRHTVVEAVAGAGKTSTLLALVAHVAPRRALLLAFNRTMAAELRARLPAEDRTSGRVDVYTLHAYAYRMWRRRGVADLDFDFFCGDEDTGAIVTVEPDKMLRVWRAMGTPPAATWRAWREVRAGVDALRHRLVADEGEGPAADVWRAMLADDATVDPEEAVFRCVHAGLRDPAADGYAVIALDECQDLNPLDLAFVQTCICPPRRDGATPTLCAVGDACQAVYGWRGAAPDGLGRLRAAYGAASLSLSGCFRCPQRVVALARCLNPRIVPVRAEPGACHVRRCVSDESWPAVVCALATAGGGLAFVARTNAPCLALARHLFLAAPTMRARWIAPGLKAALDDCCTQDDVARKKEDALADPTLRAVCALSDDAEWLGHVRALLDPPPPIDDDDGHPSLVFSTVHAAKGLDFAHVCVHAYNQYGMDADALRLLYIAITRARTSVTFLLSRGAAGCIPSPWLPLSLIRDVAAASA